MKVRSNRSDRHASEIGHARSSGLQRWRYLHIAVCAARLFMAGIFVYASIAKIAEPAAFARDIYNYQILPDALINLTALVLPWLELFLGLCLLAGIWLPGAVLAINGLMIVFLAALVFNWARGLDVNCGCFGIGGGAPSMSAGWYFLRDLSFLGVGVFLFYAVFLQRRLKIPHNAWRWQKRRENSEPARQAGDGRDSSMLL